MSGSWRGREPVATMRCAGLELHLVGAGVRGDHDAAAARDPAAAADHGRLVLAEQALDALVQLLDDLVAPPRRHPVVEAHLAGR